MIRALMMATFGLILGTIGLDTISGLTRFSFNIPNCWMESGWSLWSWGSLGFPKFY